MSSFSPSSDGGARASVKPPDRLRPADRSVKPLCYLLRSLCELEKGDIHGGTCTALPQCTLRLSARTCGVHGLLNGMPAWSRHGRWRTAGKYWGDHRPRWGPSCAIDGNKHTMCLSYTQCLIQAICAGAASPQRDSYPSSCAGQLSSADSRSIGRDCSKQCACAAASRSASVHQGANFGSAFEFDQGPRPGSGLPRLCNLRPTSIQSAGLRHLV